jgi:hypothetical protein
MSGRLMDAAAAAVARLARDRDAFDEAIVDLSDWQLDDEGRMLALVKARLTAVGHADATKDRGVWETVEQGLTKDLQAQMWKELDKEWAAAEAKAEVSFVLGVKIGRAFAAIDGAPASGSRPRRRIERRRADLVT